VSAEQAQHVLRGIDHRRASGVQTRAIDDGRQSSGDPLGDHGLVGDDATW
jgi:hypothetical protein